MPPLQVPGGPELLIIGLILLIVVALIGAVVGAIGYLSRRPSDRTAVDDQRVTDLERRVDALEQRERQRGESTETGQREP